MSTTDQEREALSNLVDSYALAFHAAIARPEAHDKMKAKAEGILEQILSRATPPAPQSTEAEPAGGDKEDAERLIIPTLTRAIQSIRGSTYNLTKDECIFVLENLRDDAARAAQQATGDKS